MARIALGYSDRAIAYSNSENKISTRHLGPMSYSQPTKKTRNLAKRRIQHSIEMRFKEEDF